MTRKLYTQDLFTDTCTPGKCTLREMYTLINIHPRSVHSNKKKCTPDIRTFYSGEMYTLIDNIMYVHSHFVMRDDTGRCEMMWDGYKMGSMEFGIIQEQDRGHDTKTGHSTA